MGSKLNYSAILLTAMFALTHMYAQTPMPTGAHTVTFRDLLRAHVEPVPEPPPALQQLSVELSGALIGRPPNLSIQFILSLENNGPQEVQILDPLDTLSFNFSTIGKRPIDVPERIPKIVLDTFGDKRDLPFPAHVRFRRIVRGTMASYEKEEVVTIPPGGKMQIEFETEPIIMEKVMEALRAETGEDAKSFRAEAFLALLNDPPQPGGRSVYSDPILFTVPAP
jgi:hypothetical protein